MSHPALRRLKTRVAKLKEKVATDLARAQAVEHKFGSGSAQHLAALAQLAESSTKLTAARAAIRKRRGSATP